MEAPWPPYTQYHKEGQQHQGVLTEKPLQLPCPVKEQAYTIYVRPILEYASPVWDPHTKELTSQLEMVQRRAARFVTADYHRRHSVTVLLNQLQWQTLLQRRTHSKVTMVYRIHHQLVAIPASPPYIIYSSTTNRGHHLQLQQHHCRINSYQHSFFPSVVNLWNQLPSDTVGAASLNMFQNRLPIPHAALNHYIGPCFICTSPCTVFYQLFTNVFYFYTNFICGPPLLRIFY